MTDETEFHSTGDAKTEAITVRVPPELKRRIEEMAEREFRNLSQQTVYLLTRGIEADAA